jgi:transcriptional antiterminator NusG
MTMQRKITMDERLDMSRIITADQRRERIAAVRTENLRAASSDFFKKGHGMAHWYVLQTRTGKEFNVEKVLSEANVQAFAPRETHVKVRGGKKFVLDMPTFPGYVLVRCMASPQAFIGLKQVNDVIDIVGGDSGYHVVRDQHVDRFRLQTPTPRKKTDKTWQQGDKAMVSEGPFAGFECLIVAVKHCRERRARVVIRIDRRDFEIESMPIAFLEKL